MLMMIDCIPHQERYGFVTVEDWTSVAKYEGPFHKSLGERPSEQLTGWLAALGI